MRNIESFEELLVFLREAPPPMMLLLVLDVANHRAQLRMAIRERAESFLPREPTRDPSALVDGARRPGLDVPHEVGKRHRRFLPNQDVHVVGHIVDRDELLALIRHDAGD